jgi:hypothetical protein
LRSIQLIAGCRGLWSVTITPLHLGSASCALLLVLADCTAPPDDLAATTTTVTSGAPATTGPTTGEPGSTGAVDPSLPDPGDAPDPTSSDTTLEPSTAGTTLEPTTTTETTTGAAEPVAADLDFDCFKRQSTARLRLLLTEAVCGADWPDVSLKIDLFGIDTLAPGTYPLGPGLGLALLIDDGAPDPTVTGSVTISAIDADAVHGSYALEFKDHGALAGDFTGAVCGGPPRCA